MIATSMNDAPSADDAKVNRYTDLPLPPYRFVPGTGQPHPMRNGGYMSKMPWVFEAVRPPKRWYEQQSYLYGVDLFNHAYWWEAHEAWEEVWHLTRDPIQHEFFHGLIQLAAGLLKWQIGRTRGVRILSVKTITRMKVVRDSGQLINHRYYMGIDMPALVDFLQRVFDPFVNSQASADSCPVEPVLIRLHLPDA